jgi:hypothetical protein
MNFLSLQVVTPPVELPITKDEFIDQARLNGITLGTQPGLIDREMEAATERGQQFCRRSFITQTLVAIFVPDYLNRASAPLLVLPRGVVQQVEEVASGGDVITGYTLTWNVITLNVPIFAPVTVRWVSGYGDARDDVPALIREGILQYATTLYESRAGERPPENRNSNAAKNGLPDGVYDCWRPYQIELSG